MIIYDNEKYLSTHEAAHYIGRNISAFRQLINRTKEFPRRKLGGRLFFPLSEIYGWFARRRGFPHLEAHQISYDDLYTLDDIRAIFGGSSAQNAYGFIARHGITRYCDNTGAVYYPKKEIHRILDAKLKRKGGKNSDVQDL